MASKWNLYTSNEIKPLGWFRRQLEIQANGLSGNLDKIWPDIKDSAWIGGSAEGWERVPYWLDGFIPLAFLLDNEDMKVRAKKYIDAIISSQKSDGWICPCTDSEREKYDTWALQLISKTLTVYYECSKDERIPDVIYSVMKNYYDMLSSGKIKLFDWGKYRWFEAFIAINFLQKRYGEPWIKSLAEILKKQGADYAAESVNWKIPLNKWTFGTHIVNIAMMFKSQAVSCDILNEEYTDSAEQLYQILNKFNGTPVGLFTGDECLSGLSPIQGTELCSVAEQMFSYELLYAYTGDKKWAERLETIAFNALPATISDDMWTHQYDQMSNQINCITFPGKAIFGTNGPHSHLFGLEPNYGCCTANFNQAWPKLALSAFMYNQNTVLSAVPIPSEVKTDAYRVTLETDYPFKNEFLYEAEAKEPVTLKIRIPSFAQRLTINGNPAEMQDMLNFDIAAGKTAEIRISYETAPEFISRPHDLKSVKCGSLVFSLPIKHEKIMHEYTTDGVERKFPYCDYELKGASPWNYAYCSESFELCRKSLSEIPFSSENPPVTIKAKAKKIDWGYEDGYDTVCAKTPHSREPVSDEEEITLYPYGCAKLRMTEMPLLEGSDSAYCLNVYYHTKPGKREEFLNAIKKEGIDKKCRNENGNIRYDYYLSDSDENEILLVEKWESKKYQQIHCTQPHAKLLQKLKAEFVENTELVEM
ncbi:MAG: antibiotic biosynthesis monooxygenase [Acutalibacteraceae bacterium]